MRQTKFIVIITVIIACIMTDNLYGQSFQQMDKEKMTQLKQHKYGLSGKLTAKAGKAEELVSILLDAAVLVSNAKGCHLYIISRDSQNENDIWVIEVWDSKEDHDNSLQIEGVSELISKAMPLIDGQPEKGLELEVLGGAGIDS